MIQIFIKNICDFYFFSMKKNSVDEIGTLQEDSSNSEEDHNLW